MDKAFLKTIKSYKQALPILFGMFFLISLFTPYIEVFYKSVFSGNYLIDPFIGSILGSISAGMPITAYVLGGELMEVGISLLAVTAFILTWTTVSLAFLPMESKYLGRRFAISRNAVNYFMAIIISILTVLIVQAFDTWFI